MDKLLRSKTFWTGVATIAAAGTGYAEGVLAAGDALQAVSTGLIGIFLRLAIAKGLAPR